MNKMTSSLGRKMSVKKIEFIENKSVRIQVNNIRHFSFQTPTPNFYKILIVLQKKTKVSLPEDR